MSDSYTISFNGLAAGTLVGDQYADKGLTITSSGANPAMIFDATQDPSGPVSGNDRDLLDPDAGGILIASEDGDSSDPDDAGGGATLGFEFDEKVIVTGLTLVDVEEGACVVIYDEAGRILMAEEFRSNDGEYLEIALSVPGAREMKVDFFGSGGIDDLSYTKGLAPDGIVNGTEGDDLIDLSYTDVDGDVIDGGDAIGIKGTTGDDDFVTAGGGDDTVFAGLGDDLVRGEKGDDSLHGEDGDDTITGGFGDDTATGGEGDDEFLMFVGDDMAEGGAGDDWMWGGDGGDTMSGDSGRDMVFGEGGDDLLYGGAGEDTVEGGTGNDTIFGDSDKSTGTGGEPICGPRESFNWAQVPGFGDGADAGDVTQNTGTVDMRFSVTGVTGSANDRYETDAQYVGGIDSGSETVDDDASYSSILQGDASAAALEFSFSSLVKNVSFNINDVDRESIVEVRAFDADGDAVDVDLTGGAQVSVSDGTASSLGGIAPDDAAEYGVTVSIPGVVSRIEVVHTLGGDDKSGINLTDLFFDPVTGFTTGGPLMTGGDDVLLGGDGDDSIEGEGGDDTIDGGAGDDTVNGGKGEDVIDGGTGDDVLRGGGGNDTVRGGEGDDSVSGSANDDSLSGGSGDDTVSGSGGDDTISGGSGDDDILGGKGDDAITAGEGSDTVSGGDGNDVIDAGVTGAHDRGYPGLFEGDADPENDRDTVDGGAGDDVIRTGDDADVVTGGAGADTIDGGFDDDTILGGADGDLIVGGEGSDKIAGDGGEDTIYGGLDPKFPDELNIVDVDADGNAVDRVPDNGRDMIDGGDGDDLIFGQDDDDTITGGAGDDTIDGGIDEDSIDGGDGADVITGGQGADTVSGGAGADMIDTGDDRDVILGATTGDMIDGGEGGDDFDTLDLTGSGVKRIDYTSEDREDGIVTFTDDSTAKFEEIENVIPCFTPGTMIATPRGEVPVEALEVGDRVITRDGGIQPIRWIGRRDMTAVELAATEGFRPVSIRQGALGHGLPERDMVVSPQHRVLVVDDESLLYFDEREVLVAAKHLVGRPGIERLGPRDVSYIHIMFDAHQIVLSDGAWTESFQPGDGSLAGLDAAQREELLALFPELREAVGRAGYAAARRALKRREVELLAR